MSIGGVPINKLAPLKTTLPLPPSDKRLAPPKSTALPPALQATHRAQAQCISGIGIQHRYRSVQASGVARHFDRELGNHKLQKTPKESGILQSFGNVFSTRRQWEHGTTPPPFNKLLIERIVDH